MGLPYGLGQQPSKIAVALNYFPKELPQILQHRHPS